MRRRIAEYCEAQSPYSGEVELDESNFGPKRIRGKRGRRAGSKTIVFGVFKRNGHVYTEIVVPRKNWYSKFLNVWNRTFTSDMALC